MAATVIGLLLRATGEPRPIEIQFFPLSTPLADGGALVTTTDPKVTTSFEDGTFSIELEEGDYRVVIGEDIVTIAVPNDELVHQFVDLLTSALQYIYPNPAPNQYPIATATVSGGVKTNTTVADPVVYRKQEVDALIASQVDKNAEYVIASPTNIWGPYSHGLGKIPAVALLDNSGNYFASDIQVDDTTVIARHGENLAGKMVLN